MRISWFRSLSSMLRFCSTFDGLDTPILFFVIELFRQQHQAECLLSNAWLLVSRLRTCIRVFGKHSSSCQSKFRLDTIRSTDLNLRQFFVLVIPVSQLNPKNQGFAQGRHHRIIRLGPIHTFVCFFRLLPKNAVSIFVFFSTTFFHPSDNGRQKPA